MGFLFKQLETRSSLANPSSYLKDYFSGAFGISNNSGITVSESNADAAVAVGACINIISNTIATLPLDLYKRNKDNDRLKAYTNPLYNLLKNQPNKHMSAFVWRNVMTRYYLKYGVCYAKIDYNQQTGKIENLWPVPPNYVSPIKNGNDIYFEVRDDNGNYTVLNSGELFRVFFNSDDGYTPKSPIRTYAESIGLSLAQERFAALTFGKGTNASGVLMHPGRLDPEGVAFKNLRKSWEEIYAGINNSHKVMILEEGMKFERTNVTAEDTQLLESRKFQAEEIARIYNVPINMIQLNYNNSSTYSNAEQDDLRFQKFTILPHAKNWEQSISQYLITDTERFYAEFNFDLLLKADSKTRSAFYHQMLSDGVLSADEVRAMENFAPQKYDENADIGKKYLVLNNFIEKKPDMELTDSTKGATIPLPKTEPE